MTEAELGERITRRRIGGVEGRTGRDYIEK